jgi:hypothetical protein
MESCLELLHKVQVRSYRTQKPAIQGQAPPFVFLVIFTTTLEDSEIITKYTNRSKQ